MVYVPENPILALLITKIKELPLVECLKIVITVCSHLLVAPIFLAYLVAMLTTLEMKKKPRTNSKDVSVRRDGRRFRCQLSVASQSQKSVWCGNNGTGKSTLFMLLLTKQASVHWGHPHCGEVSIPDSWLCTHGAGSRRKPQTTSLDAYYVVMSSGTPKRSFETWVRSRMSKLYSLQFESMAIAPPTKGTNYGRWAWLKTTCAWSAL
jgi:hypothetical protein